MSGSMKKTIPLRQDLGQKRLDLTWVATEEEREECLKILAERAGVSKRYQGLCWDDWQVSNKSQEYVLQAVRRYGEAFQEMAKYGISMIFRGKTGTGKSLLASILVSFLVRKGYKPFLAEWWDILDELAEAGRFDSDRPRSRVISDLVDPDLLVLDEVSDGGREAYIRDMQRIINKRYNQSKPTIIITNLVEEEISQCIGDRVLDRIRQSGGGVLVFDWDSLRK